MRRRIFNADLHRLPRPPHVDPFAASTCLSKTMSTRPIAFSGVTPSLTPAMLSTPDPTKEPVTVVRAYGA
jgi:hypothetical protein